MQKHVKWKTWIDWADREKSSNCSKSNRNNTHLHIHTCSTSTHARNEARTIKNILFSVFFSIIFFSFIVASLLFPLRSLLLSQLVSHISKCHQTLQEEEEEGGKEVKLSKALFIISIISFYYFDLVLCSPLLFGNEKKPHIAFSHSHFV